MDDDRTAVDEKGWFTATREVQEAALTALLEEVAPFFSEAGGRGGVRNLLDLPGVRRFAASAAVREVVEPVLGAGCFAVRGLLFDKTADANWMVGWHQDVTIAAHPRRNVPGFGVWSQKAGVPHVQASAEVLEQMLSVRVHLDPCGPDNGPLRVLPGSHREGRMGPAAVERWLAVARSEACLAPRGAIVAFRPLLLHASSPATCPHHRRVVHLEFAAGPLPGGLNWYWQV